MIERIDDTIHSLKWLPTGRNSWGMRVAFLLFLVALSLGLMAPEAMSSPHSMAVSDLELAITRYEAEDAMLNGVVIAKSGTDFSGTGYMDGGSFDLDSDQITFTVDVPIAAAYPLVIRFKNTCGACEKAQFISINRAANQYTSFTGTSGAWQDLNVGNIDLKAGSNTIAISKSWGYTHIDYISIGDNDVTAPSAPVNVKFSGLTQTSFTLSWDASTDNVGVMGYEVYFGTSLKGSTLTTSLKINDLTCNTTYSDITIKAKDNAGTISEASYPISVRTNTCVLFALTVNNGSGTGAYNSGVRVTLGAHAAPAGMIFDQWTGSTAIEKVNLAETFLTMPEGMTEVMGTYKAVDPAKLIDPAATPETVNLWLYLKSIYGQKMLSGCWTETQFGGNAKVVSCTGETPAIWGQDMNSWYQSRTEQNWINTWNQNIAGFKKAHSRGQILQVNWHWQMPSSKLNGAYTRDAWGRNSAGGSQMMTTQQWTDIVTPGTDLYNAMIEDIDYHVVNFLKKIVDTNGVPIPILFRPLHEIDGGWFWWTCPSDPTKTAQLFKIMVDRIMNFHGCHNLIWVYNPGVTCNGVSGAPYQATENARRKLFYPGDEFCDITGIDLYEYDPAVRGTFANTGKTFRDAWNMLKALAPSKMTALCESEGMPDVDKSFTNPDYAPWLYSLPWFAENYKDNTTGLTRDLCEWNKIQFKSAYVVNAGDFNITSVETPVLQEQSGMRIFPNPATYEVTISLDDKMLSEKLMVTVFDGSGKVVRNFALGKEKSLRLDTRDYVKGIYMIKLSDGRHTLCGKLVIQ